MQVIGSDMFCGQMLSGNVVSFTSARKSLLTKLIDCLADRFEVDEEILNATSIANLNAWPPSLQDEPDFGNHSLTLLTKQFGPALQQENTESLYPEWIRFKHLLYARFNNVSAVTWAQINSALVGKCPNILALMTLSYHYLPVQLKPKEVFLK
ncbi:uncharacterized protein [Ptychodera flava]|uniref:uncharacterized protein n=1 Tax=Ptychodera flava TaxID=63121 RepID=UPI00396A1B61